jgi:hypothetical protein
MSLCNFFASFGKLLILIQGIIFLVEIQKTACFVGTRMARAQLTWGAFGLSADVGAQLTGRKWLGRR